MKLKTFTDHYDNLQCKTNYSCKIHGNCNVNGEMDNILDMNTNYTNNIPTGFSITDYMTPFFIF